MIPRRHDEARYTETPTTIERLTAAVLFHFPYVLRRTDLSEARRLELNVTMTMIMTELGKPA